jgi:hypothetical protein
MGNGMLRPGAVINKFNEDGLSKLIGMLDSEAMDQGGRLAAETGLSAQIDLVTRGPESRKLMETQDLVVMFEKLGMT